VKDIIHGLVEVPLIDVGPHQVLMEMEKMSIALVLLVRTPNYFCGTWHWTRLLSRYGILQVPHRHLAVGALPRTGTMHALQQVFCNLLLECETSPNSRPLLPTEYMLIPYLAWCSPMNQSSPSAVRASSKSGFDQTRVKTINNQILQSLF